MAAKALAFVALGLLLGGCIQQGTLEAASDTNLKPRDRQLLANAPYQQAHDSRTVSPSHRHVSSQGSARYNRDR